MTPLTDQQAETLAAWRGYSPAIVAYLREKQLVGMHEGCIAFATTGGCHYRVKDGSWRYSEGAKASPFLLGLIEEGAHVHAFESQFDAIAFADSSGERNNVVATRGAGNAKLVIDAVGKDFSGTLYLWKQNDAPGQKWAQDVRRLFPGQIKAVVTPKKYKDLAAWRKAGATDGQIFSAMIDAKDLSGGAESGVTASATCYSGPKDDANASPAQNILKRPAVVESRSHSVAEQSAQATSGASSLNAVPVLAEPMQNREESGVIAETKRGEARESTVAMRQTKRDSRGGQKLTGAVNGRGGANVLLFSAVARLAPLLRLTCSFNTVFNS